LPRRAVQSPSLARTNGYSDQPSSPPEPSCAPQRLQPQSLLHTRSSKPESPADLLCWIEGASFYPEARSRRSTPSANRSVAKPARKYPGRNPKTHCAIPRNSETCLGCFTQTTLSSFSPSGLFPVQRGTHVSVNLPPVLLKRELSLFPQLRRVEPSAQCEPPPITPKRHRQQLLGPLGVFPSEALPPAAVEPTSRPFLSRASVAEATGHHRVLPPASRFQTQTRKSKPHRPLWGFPP